MPHPSLEDLKRRLAAVKPHIVYLTGGFSPYRDLLNAQQNPLSFAELKADGQPSGRNDVPALVHVFHGAEIETLYIDAPLTPTQGIRNTKHRQLTS